MAGTVLLAGCGELPLGEEVTPEQIALEVIVTPDACSLNAEEVGAATHPVAVITEHGTGHVRILDHADTVIFEADSTDLAEQEVPEDDNHPQTRRADEGEQSTVRLAPGDYQVECSMDNSVSRASLHVIAASGSTERTVEGGGPNGR